MQKLDRIRLARVQYIPKNLEPGILYVAEEFGAAVHLCACGCGLKVSTPLRPVGWTLEESAAGATLFPSIGNWQQPCKTHYWIREGTIIWAEDWTPAQVAAGRRSEDQRRRAYFDSRQQKPTPLLRRLWQWFRRLVD
jgi:hypothetical protein